MDAHHIYDEPTTPADETTPVISGASYICYSRTPVSQSSFSHTLNSIPGYSHVVTTFTFSPLSLSDLPPLDMDKLSRITDPNFTSDFGVTYCRIGGTYFRGFNTSDGYSFSIDYKTQLIPYLL